MEMKVKAPLEVNELLKYREFIKKIVYKHPQTDALFEVLGLFPHLECLEVYGHELQYSIQKVKWPSTLEHIVLSISSLKQLPLELILPTSYMKNLKILKFKNGQLRKLPEVKEDHFPKICSGPSTIELANHLLSELPEWFCRLHFIKNLSLSGNRLKTLPSNFHLLKNLTRLNLDGNQLTRVPPGLLNLPHLKKLSLDNNPLAPEEQADLFTSLQIW